ncbi:hypothetical protein ACGFNU_12850 [Spirillospora sp. NPDC048911]|uniref:hypothetical protein n=1 Tax=Spirillospora sp. NPDC048911 TaxID=3364527 RepID=UPI00371C0DF8
MIHQGIRGALHFASLDHISGGRAGQRRAATPTPRASAQTLADGQTFSKDVKTRAERPGRDPDGIKILPGICPIIGSTEEEARRLEQELTDLQVIDYGLAQLSGMLNHLMTRGCRRCRCAWRPA